jgi:hypothetical protein
MSEETYVSTPVQPLTVQIPNPLTQYRNCPVIIRVNVQRTRPDGSTYTDAERAYLTTGSGETLHVITWRELVDEGVTGFNEWCDLKYIEFDGYMPVNQENLELLAQRTSEWSVGCGCGASFVLIPTEDLTQWKIADPRVKPTLNWVKDEQNNARTFECTNCHRTITLQS